MSRQRPGIVTAAAVVTFIQAALLIILGLAAVAAGSTTANGTGAGIGAVFLVIGILFLVGGVLLLRGSDAARWILGILAAVSLVSAIIGIGRGNGGSVVSIVIDVFLVYALLIDARARAYFERR